MTAFKEFAARPLRLRIWIGAAVLLALALPVALGGWPNPVIDPRDLWAAVALVAGSVANVELGRRLEGGRVSVQRPHKALSAWPMAATVLLPSFYLVPVVALIYAHARWRGVRVTLWKWIGSACFLICAGAISGAILDREGDGAPPTLTSGLEGLVIVVAAVLTFLVIECSMLGMCMLTNTPQDETWLRKTLADPAFYVVELGVLVLGAITGLLAANAPWFVLLLIPAYGFLQQAVLHRPLQERATRDPKTGLLHFNAWQQLATEEIRRLNSAEGPWAVLFVDIDYFRFYNERHGHLGGDHALNLVAQILTANVRPRDIIARFGGEEFCALLPDTAAEAAEQIAERLRLAIGTGTSALPETVTVSVGVAAVAGNNTPMELAVVLALADQALYEAKMDGRNTVRLRRPVATESVGTDPATRLRDLGPTTP